MFSKVFQHLKKIQNFWPKTKRCSFFECFTLKSHRGQTYVILHCFDQKRFYFTFTSHFMVFRDSVPSQRGPKCCLKFLNIFLMFKKNFKIFGQRPNTAALLYGRSDLLHEIRNEKNIQNTTLTPKIKKTNNKKITILS